MYFLTWMLCWWLCPPSFFLTLPALFGEHNAGEQWSGILMANYKMPFLWKKYQRNPSEICSKFRKTENILLWSIFSGVEFETHRSWLWMKIYSEKSIKEPKRSRPIMLNGGEVLTQVSEKKFTFEAQMRISDCMLKSKIYLITHDRVSEFHYHVSQNILRKNLGRLQMQKVTCTQEISWKNFSMA